MIKAGTQEKILHSGFFVFCINSEKYHPSGRFFTAFRMTQTKYVMLSVSMPGKNNAAGKVNFPRRINLRYVKSIFEFFTVRVVRSVK